ncbi:MAG: energy transducer TonB [bacterium]|nr:energy transducer TonB [bacterium]
MKRGWSISILVILGLGALSAGRADAGTDTGDGAGDVLVVRYASLVGGREAGSAPISSGVLGRRELHQFLLEWQPESDNAEVREVFALNDLGELARQATQLPLNGGAVSGVYVHGDSSFEIDMDIRPSKTLDSGDDVMTISAKIKRDGELLSGPTIHTRLGERAIVTSAEGPDGPFLFLVVEVDRMSQAELGRRGLRHSWRKDLMLVDGEEVTAPVPIEKTQPAYPAEARELKHQGRVVLRMVINAEGVIEGIEVLEGQPYGLSEAAVAAAKTWRFKPALYEGEPVAVVYMVTVNFRLE